MKNNPSSPKSKADKRAPGSRGGKDVPGTVGEPLSPPEALSVQDAGWLIRELRLHQIELETQNEELREAQAELYASRAHVRDLYDSAPVGYCSLSVQGVILECNRTLVHFLGVTRAALVGQDFSRFVFKEDQDVYYHHRRRLFDTEAPQGCELRMARGDGAVLWMSLTTSSALFMEGERDGQGQTVRHIVLSDISDRKAAQVENVRLEAKLQQTRLQETLGLLAGGVAAEFDDLLEAIVDTAIRVRLLLESGSELYPCFESILESTVKAKDFAQQLLAYSGRMNLVMDEMDPRDMVRGISHTLVDSLPPNVTLQCELGEDIPPVQGDSIQLFQVLANLLTNAFEAFGPGMEGVISVRLRRETVAIAEESRAWPLPAEPGHYVAVEVADTGIGMMPEILDRAFDPLFTTKFRGRGLGLAAVTGILKRHKAGLNVTSAPGKGSSFRFYLPALLDRTYPGTKAIATRASNSV